MLAYFSQFHDECQSGMFITLIPDKRNSSSFAIFVRCYPLNLLVEKDDKQLCFDLRFSSTEGHTQPTHAN